jgi:dGTPase
MSNQNPSYNYCAVPLAAYACRADQSQGRVYVEEPSEHRTCFQRDRDRVIHATAFRRLKYKTQVFVYSHGDHYRTRLTHTLEVAQIARTIARALHVNEDLAEVIALSHDLGHPPFAHTGEEALIEAMRNLGGFEHNDQSLRVVTALEDTYPRWKGLNLTWETLEGIVKHNGPVSYKKLPHALAELQRQTDLRLNSYASLEAQIAALADDIAYNNHDVQDGLAAGIFTLEALNTQVPLMADITAKIDEAYPDLAEPKRHAAIIRELIGMMVVDVLTETQKRLENHDIKTVEDIRNADKAMVAFSDNMFEKVQVLRKFLMNKMYLHHTVNRMRFKAERVIHDLFDVFIERPECLPEDWQFKVKPYAENSNERARIICDYIAGMTDRFALREHAKLFDLKEG